MRFRVQILRRAAHDIREISEWISFRSKPGAANWMSALKAVLDGLLDDPERFGVAEEDDEVPELTLRQFLFKTKRGRAYRGVFTVVGDEVRVLRIRGPGQDSLSAEDL